MKFATKRWALPSLVATLAGALMPVRAWAEEAAAAAAAAPKIDTGDTAWVLMSAGLVCLMTPALAFFYGGLVRKKNMLSVLQQCMMAMALLTDQWIFIGYTL